MQSTTIPLTGMVVIQRETQSCHLPSFWEGFAKIAFHEKKLLNLLKGVGIQVAKD